MSNTSSLKLEESHQCFNGVQAIYSHFSQELDCVMRFGIYLPPFPKKLCPTLYWLSGLTSTHENFVIKAGAQRVASQLGIILISTDTSARDIEIPEAKLASDLGEGAGFYLDATQFPWSKHYKMYSYITQELTAILPQHFPIDQNRCGILGHSMGGHGALTIALKNPTYFKTVSAFAPICAPTQCAWGRKAFQAYLGSQQSDWQNYDACYLIEKLGWQGPPILIDQGSEDPFLSEQLKPELLQAACFQAKVPLHFRLQKGYDHSYFFIATFIEDHLKFHLNALK